MSEEDLVKILSSHTQTLSTLGAKQHQHAARLDATEIILRSYAKKLGLRDDLLGQEIRKLAANLYQKRLERLEDQCPAAAAWMCPEPASPLLDQALLDILELESSDAADGGTSPAA